MRNTLKWTGRKGDVSQDRRAPAERGAGSVGPPPSPRGARCRRAHAAQDICLTRQAAMPAHRHQPNNRVGGLLWHTKDREDLSGASAKSGQVSPPEDQGLATISTRGETVCRCTMDLPDAPLSSAPDCQGVCPLPRSTKGAQYPRSS